MGLYLLLSSRTFASLYRSGFLLIFRFSEVNLGIKAGEHSLSQDDSLEQWDAVLKYKIHEEYNSFTFENDIALLFVSPQISQLLTND